MFAMLSGLEDVGALGATVSASSATDILFGLGQQQITDPNDQATFTKYGRSYIKDFVNDFYAAGYVLVSSPSKSGVAGATLLPIMQKRNSGYWFKLTDDQLLKMSAAIDALPSSGYAFMTVSDAVQPTSQPTSQPVSQPVSVQITDAVSNVIPWTVGASAAEAAGQIQSLPAVSQTPSNVVAVATVPAVGKTSVMIDSLPAAMSVVNSYAPTMSTVAKQSAAQMLYNARKGRTAYLPKKTNWMPWVLGGAGFVLLAGVIYFTYRKKA